MTQADLAILNTEITDDPLDLGYTGKSDPDIAGILNAVNENYEIDREAIDGQELQMAVTLGDYNNLTDKQRDFWQTILSAGSGIVAVSDSRVKTHIAAIWVAGTDTRANLVALQKRSASRAEMVLERAGASISMTDVAVSLGRY